MFQTDDQGQVTKQNSRPRWTSTSSCHGQPSQDRGGGSILPLRLLQLQHLRHANDVLTPDSSRTISPVNPTLPGAGTMILVTKLKYEI